MGKAKRAHGRLAVFIDTDVGTARRAFVRPTLTYLMFDCLLQAFPKVRVG